jgi:hypothetical protein
VGDILVVDRLGEDRRACGGGEVRCHVRRKRQGDRRSQATRLMRPPYATMVRPGNDIIPAVPHDRVANIVALPVELAVSITAARCSVVIVMVVIVSGPFLNLCQLWGGAGECGGVTASSDLRFSPASATESGPFLS